MTKEVCVTSHTHDTSQKSRLDKSQITNGLRVSVSVRVSVRVRVRVSVSVCVCERERERKRVSAYVSRVRELICDVSTVRDV